MERRLASSAPGVGRVAHFEQPFGLDACMPPLMWGAAFRMARLRPKSVFSGSKRAGGIGMADVTFVAIRVGAAFS